MDKRIEIIALILISILSISSLSSYAQDKKQLDITKFVGKYVLEDSGFKKVRQIKIKDDRLYYIAGNTKIPLKHVNENRFNLYPSQTFIEFEETENGEISVTITKGSGGIIVGKRVSSTLE